MAKVLTLKMKNLQRSPTVLILVVLMSVQQATIYSHPYIIKTPSCCIEHCVNYL